MNLVRGKPGGGRGDRRFRCPANIKIDKDLAAFLKPALFPLHLVKTYNLNYLRIS